MSGRPKIMNSKVMLQAIEANPVTPGEYHVSLASHNPVWLVTFMTLVKASRAGLLPKYYKTFDLL